MTALHCHIEGERSGSTTKDMDDVHRRRCCRSSIQQAVELARLSCTV